MLFEHDLSAYSSVFEYSTDNSSEQQGSNTVLGVLCWAEDHCMPEIREQGDRCSEAEERDISLCPSVFLLFCAKRLQHQCKATPCPSLTCIFHQTHTDAVSLIRGKVGLFRRMEVFRGRGLGGRDLNISSSACFSQKMM